MNGLKYPRIGSLESRTLARLLRSERMTHRHFQDESHSYRLASYIHSLSLKGWHVERRQRASRTNDPAGRKATYTVYFLSLNTIKTTGRYGLEYALKVFHWEERRSRGKAATTPSRTTNLIVMVRMLYRSIVPPNSRKVILMAKGRPGRRGGSPPFVRLFHSLLDSPRYIVLSHTAKTLLVDVARHYNGRNNGDLAITPKVMKKRGWRSNSTLRRALRELLDTELLMLTRQGGRNKCSLYALTWLPVDECGGKLDIKPCATPPIPLTLPMKK